MGRKRFQPVDPWRAEELPKKEPRNISYEYCTNCGEMWRNNGIVICDDATKTSMCFCCSCCLTEWRAKKKGDADEGNKR